MRPIPLVALVLMLAVIPEPTALAVAATAAATLLEAVPFVLAAWLLAKLLPRASRWVSLLGCGCGGGPSAQSLPAAAATWLAFGPWIAIGRFVAAIALSRLSFDKLRMTHTTCHAELVEAGDAPIATLHSLLPFAIVAGVVSHVLPMLYGFSTIDPVVGALAGALLGFTLAPCGLGVVGVAGALRGISPAASLGFLCVAGIADVRALLDHHAAHVDHDPTAYVIAAVACLLVSWHGGATLVHPRFVIPLLVSVAVLIVLAWKHRRNRSARAIIAPALLLAVGIAGAPPPTYHATPTTLADAFPGEDLTFPGVVARTGTDTSLVRYAITCCRADAAPIAVLLADPVSARDGTWLQAGGALVFIDGSLRLRVARSHAVAPPSDPFLYR